MSKHFAPNSVRAWLATLKPSNQARFLTSLTADQMRGWLDDAWEWLLDTQREPAGDDWRTWLFLGGRGAGKTRAGAAWVAENARAGRFGRVALIAPTLHDAREVMIDGPSGLAAIARPRPRYEITRRRLIWPNGAEAHCFSASDPESLRGPEFDAAWGDEIAYWQRPDDTLQVLAHGLRRGARPRLMLTTTPRPMPLLKALLARADTVLTRGTTLQNRANLAPGFIAALEAGWRGTAHQRQELYGDLIADPEGALWRRADVEAVRVTHAPALKEIIVAVDPPASVGPKADLCGIVAAGALGEGLSRRYCVLADWSVQGASPRDWADRAARLARTLGAFAIVAEANNGGEMVRSLLALAAPDMLIRLVHARGDKRGRAAHAAALYELGLVSHAGAFAALEDQMCSFGAPGFSGSPDRVDALVWALTHLHGASEPRMRQL